MTVDRERLPSPGASYLKMKPLLLEGRPGAAVQTGMSTPTTMMAPTMAGVSAAPRRDPAWVMPWAKPRSEGSASAEYRPEGGERKIWLKKKK